MLSKETRSSGRYDEPWEKPNQNYDAPWGNHNSDKNKSGLNYDEPWDAIGSTNGTISSETGKTR